MADLVFRIGDEDHAFRATDILPRKGEIVVLSGGTYDVVQVVTDYRHDPPTTVAYISKRSLEEP